MDKVIAFFTKIYIWIKANLASVLGIAQAVIKALKEVVTALINLVSIFLPTVATEKFVLTLRDALNTVDEWIEKIKPALVPKV